MTPPPTSRPHPPPNRFSSRERGIVVCNVVMSINRWSIRVHAYVSLMTDAYPPFRPEQGGRDLASPETMWRAPITSGT